MRVLIFVLKIFTITLGYRIIANFFLFQCRSEMIIENPEALKTWLTTVLAPLYVFTKILSFLIA